MRRALAGGFAAALLLAGCVPASRSDQAASCPSRIAPQSLEPITGGLGQPSAALVTADDRLWIADTKSGTVGRLNPDGSLTIWAHGLHHPTSMVEFMDGSILVAEADSGAIMHVIPGLGLFQFRAPDPGMPGITGMVNSHGDSVLAAIPGHLIRVSRGHEEVILHGLGARPQLALEPSGGVLISDQNLGLERLDANGVLGAIAGVPALRSLVVDHHGWLVFVNTRGELWRWMGGSGTRLLSGIPPEATIAVDQADNVVVVDPQRNRVLRLVTSFVIQPTQRVRAGFGKAITLCVPIERASGYKEPITMSVAAVPPGMSAIVEQQPSVTHGATLSLLSDLTQRLRMGAVVLNVESGTLRQRFFVTLDFGG